MPNLVNTAFISDDATWRRSVEASNFYEVTLVVRDDWQCAVV